MGEPKPWPGRGMSQPPHGLRALCEWAAALRLEDISPEIQARLALVAADTVACAAAAAGDAELNTWAPLPAAVAQSRLDATESSVWGSLRRLPRAMAARANATQANWWQLDEGHHEVMCHAGLYCVPAALAEHEAEGTSLGELIRTLAVGYEVTCRIASAYRLDAHAPHPHALWSALGASAVLAAARRYSAREFMAVLDQAAACMPVDAPFEWVLRGDLIANTWAGTGVEHGFACAAAARQGALATEGTLHHHLAGRLHATLEACRLDMQLGARWAVQRNYHKLMACAGQSHAAIEALLQARASMTQAGAGNPLARIRAEVHAFATGMDVRDPRTSLAARFSIPHLLAVVWIHGRTDPDALGALYLDDPQVALLRCRVELLEGPATPAPHHRAASVTVEVAGGISAHGACRAPAGSPGNPLSPLSIAAKCRALGGKLPAGPQAELLAALLRYQPSASASTPG